MSYWYTMFSLFIMGIPLILINSNVPADLIEKGYEISFAAAIVCGILIIQPISKIFLGDLNDRIGNRYCLLISQNAFVIGTVLFIISKQTWTIWMYGFFTGVSMSALAVLIPLFVANIIGKKNSLENSSGSLWLCSQWEEVQGTLSSFLTVKVLHQRFHLVCNPGIARVGFY